MLQLKSIHYLRAIAALMVVVFHIFSNVTFMHPQLDLVYWLRGGVDIFFVISGYVMVTSTENRSITPGHFMVQRAKRIVPIYWIATFATMMQIDGLWDLKLKSFLFIPAMNPTINMMQPVLEPGWTLNYEMFFYAIFALSLFSVRKYQFPIVAALISTTVFFGWLVDGSSIFEFYGRPIILEFLMGMAIAKFRFRLPAATFPAGFLLMYFLQPLSLGRIIELGIPAMLIVSSALSAEKYIKKSRILDFLGSASYSIYLFHLLAIDAVVYSYPHLGLNHFSFVGIAFMACLISGCAFYLTLERPIIAYFNASKTTQIRAENQQIA